MRFVQPWYAAIIVMLASTNAAWAQPGDGHDPYQDYNRHMYTINDTVDRAVFKPLATLYQTVTPNFAREGVTNFFNNLDEIPTVMNDFFQGNTYAGGRDTWRFLINSTIGVVGLFDVASRLGLPKNRQDFGLTLATYGYTSSSYLILPLLGPSTVRDAIGIPVDYVGSIYPYVDDNVNYTLNGVDAINERANLLRYNNLQNVVFDPYVALRNAYLQNRDQKIAQVRKTPVVQ